MDHLNSADLCVSYNGLGFDNPMLESLANCPITAPQYDILAQIWAAVPSVRGMHGVWSLDGVARRTLARGKARCSDSVPELWSAGREAEVIEHCVSDVMLTHDLYQFINTYGYIIGPDKEAVHLPAGTM